jgi:hypothetical protein
MRKDEPEFPETRIPTAMILAMRVIDVLEESGATNRDRKLAIVIANSLVLDSLLYPSESHLRS